MPPEQAQQRLLFVLSRAPHGDSLAQDCLDAAMTGALLNQAVTILFVGDGIFQLSEPASIAKIQSLQDLCPIQLLAAKEDLEKRQVEAPVELQQLDSTQVASQFDAHDCVLSF